MLEQMCDLPHKIQISLSTSMKVCRFQCAMCQCAQCTVLYLFALNSCDHCAAVLHCDTIIVFQCYVVLQCTGSVRQCAGSVSVGACCDRSHLGNLTLTRIVGRSKIYQRPDQTGKVARGT